MPPLSDHEKRTVRLGAIVLACGLAMAGGLWGVRHLQSRQAEYGLLLSEAREVRDEIDRYKDKASVAQKLIDTYHLDPMTLARTSLVAQASAAIQKAAGQSGVAPGAIRESPGRSGSKEIATIQFEGNGQVTGIMAFLYNLERAGSPLVVDSVRITSDPRRPGAVKVDLTIVVLDFDQWKKEEGQPNA